MIVNPFMIIDCFRHLLIAHSICRPREFSQYREAMICSSGEAMFVSLRLPTVPVLCESHHSQSALYKVTKWQIKVHSKKSLQKWELYKL